MDWPSTSDELDREQRRLAAATSALWVPPVGELHVAGVFLAFARGQEGPGHPGDRAWAGAALVTMPGGRVVEAVAVECVAGARYDPGRLALREGPALGRVLSRLRRPSDVVLVDATGRDHPRGAGLAVHLGAVLDVPTVGVTHRPLAGRGVWPADEAGAATPLTLGTVVVGAWLRTRAGARPVVVHAGWRTDPTTAVQIVRRCVIDARTPEPLRQARIVARTARARAEGRVTT